MAKKHEYIHNHGKDTNKWICKFTYVRHIIKKNATSNPMHIKRNFYVEKLPNHRYSPKWVPLR